MTSKTTLNIAYLSNPDKVYYSEMDDEIISRLTALGANIINISIDDISFAVHKGEIDILIKNIKTELHGFLSYGYMSKFHFEAYMYIISTLHSLNIPCLHTPEVESILNNKYLQSLYYSKSNIPIPTTHIGFSVESFKSLGLSYYKNNSILKKLDDYGGDGVCQHFNKDNLINNAAKLLWKNEYCIFQEYIKDSFGKSIRVLCIEGKGVAVAEYVDKSNNFKSNGSYGYEFFSLDSMMENPKLKKYIELGEKAIASIGNITIGGVDILDSSEKGEVVLEINGWPDIYDIAHSTKIDVFDIFAKAFFRKVEMSLKK